VVVSDTFAQANDLDIGDTLGAIINGRWQDLQIVGTALSPEYVYEIRGTDLLPDNQRFGVIWMGREALATAFDMDGAFNDVALTLTPGSQRSRCNFSPGPAAQNPTAGWGPMAGATRFPTDLCRMKSPACRQRQCSCRSSFWALPPFC
jgi:hypothetical protein